MVRPTKPMENKDSGGGYDLRRILRAIVALIVSGGHPAHRRIHSTGYTGERSARLLVQPGVGRQRLVHRMAWYVSGRSDL